MALFIPFNWEVDNLTYYNSSYAGNATSDGTQHTVTAGNYALVTWSIAITWTYSSISNISYTGAYTSDLMFEADDVCNSGHFWLDAGDTVRSRHEGYDQTAMSSTATAGQINGSGDCRAAININGTYRYIHDSTFTSFWVWDTTSTANKQFNITAETHITIAVHEYVKQS